jgi:hypothetical protein
LLRGARPHASAPCGDHDPFPHAHGQVTKLAPFVVLRVSDLMDAAGVLQGQPGYANQTVLPRDMLLRVDSESVEHTSVTHLHQLLSGELHSCVELCFRRASTGEEFSVKVTRHAAHAAGPCGGGVSTDEVAALRERVKQLETAKADAEIIIHQRAMELHEAKQECNVLRRAAEKAKADAESACVELIEEKRESSKWRRAVEELQESDRIRASLSERKQESFEQERAELQRQLRISAAELETTRNDCQILRKSVVQLEVVSEPRGRERPLGCPCLLACASIAVRA